jgi:hypothetical protein
MELITPVKNFHWTDSVACGLYYKHITMVNDDSSVINKFEASLADNARVIIYDQHMFIVQVAGSCTLNFFTVSINTLM